MAELKKLTEEELKGVKPEEIKDGAKSGEEEVEGQGAIRCFICGNGYYVYGFPAYARCPWCGNVGRIIY